MVICATYNCNSVRNNSEIVKDLLGSVDISFLQEIMLSRNDVGILNQFNPNFENTAFVSDKDNAGINEGRPSAGVAIFWRRNLSPFVKPMNCNDSLIGIIFDNRKDKILILNVYLPCDYQNFDALDKYRHALANMEPVIRERNINDVIVVGDFNADPSKGRFWKELLTFCESLSLSVVDKKLPNDSFTYLCPTRNTTSWLDHILSTCGVAQRISDVFINYESAIYDHFPLHFICQFSFDIPPDCSSVTELVLNMVNWSKLSPANKEHIKSVIDDVIEVRGLICHDLFYCTEVNCSNPIHLQYLDEMFEEMKSLLLMATEEFSVNNVKSFKIIPGWNDFVKSQYAEARKHFLIWKSYDKPQEGIYLENMKFSRVIFRNAFKGTGRSEEVEISRNITFSEKILIESCGI